ncbi:DNA-directed DNA polymerase alpha subunit pol12 [Dimargaris xerosporica]|nr:DNA-directed DNA polymerase alpha subunit pol12 [Dimargaris xerosporica]
MTCQEKRAGVPVQVMAAAGPFTLDDNLEFETLVDFFDVVQGEKPDVVILQGPFLDHRHPLIAQGDVDLSMDEMFQLYIASHFRQLAKTCPHTKIILVPSPRDLLHPYVSLPQPPLEVITKFQLPSNVMCLPNPAQFRINEVHFAVSNVDVLFHLGAEEISRATPTARRMDRLGRLTKHLLDQRNLYPVFPPALHDVNLQYQHLDFLRLPHAPDVLLTSSQLNHFAKKVDNVLCINTGFLTKKQVGGTFAKLSVFPLTALPMPSTTSSLQAPVFSVPHNVSDRTRVDIVRV